ncbi:MAG: hypothetical protein HQ522_06430 [Bacteroidetes bacterium]|nr:hypothetical protein [Bacteroidota bacterium]
MKVYTKKYIGKGQEVVTGTGVKLEIVKVSLSVEEMMKFVHTYNGKDYVSFEVAKLRKEDDYGNTHTVYHTLYEEEATPAEKKPVVITVPKPRKGRPTKAQIAAKLKEAERVEAMQNFTDPMPSSEQEALKAEMQMENAGIDRDLPF